MVNLYNNGDINRANVPLIEGENVAIIGAGNVAMDAARTALRMGAKSVNVIYRGTEENIPALKTEYNEALEEGTHFMWQSRTIECIGENNTLKAIRVETPEGEKVMPMDRVFIALGSKPANRTVSASLGIGVDDNGYVITK